MGRLAAGFLHVKFVMNSNHKMLQSRAVRFITCGTFVVMVSEVAYYTFWWLKKYIQTRLQSDNLSEICEVIWTNELSEYCDAKNGPLNASTNSKDAVNDCRRSVKLINIKHTCNNRYCSAHNIGRLVELIDATQYSIDLAMYTFTAFELSQALQRAMKRGVLVRIVSDHEMAYSTGSQVLALTKLGIAVRCNSNSTIVHHKFCILDSPTRVKAIKVKQKQTINKKHTQGVLLTGSLNWTIQGFGSNWENILITSNTILIEEYTQEFERIWQKFEFDFK